MIIPSLVALCFAASALAVPVFGGIRIELSGPSSRVNSADELVLMASVTNTGADTLKILKYGTILDSDLPTRSFTVTKESTTIPFTGIKLSVSLADADDSAYTAVLAGETVTVTHDVGALFDFASAGAGTFSFEPVTTFQIIESPKEVASISDLTKIFVSSNTVDVEVTDVLSKRKPQADRRATDICTTTSRKSFIDASYTEAKSLATIASNYVTSRGSSDSLYKAYWGSSSISTVTSVLNRVASESSSSRTLSCVDSYGACTSGVIAYTVISTTDVYFCSIFFNEVATPNLCSGTTVASRNIRGGTILHELTHATSGTDDITYGCSADQALSDSQSVDNADNYNCFTTQVYANTQC